MMRGLKRFFLSFKFLRLIYYKLNKSYKNFIDLNLTDNSIVIDLGANIGLISQLLFDKYNCKLYSYEPNETAFNLLKKRFKKNKKVICIKAAVTNNNKDKRIYFHKLSEKDPIKYSVASSLIKKKDNLNISNSKIIKTVTIKSVLKKFKKIDLIKIDIEGYEYRILDEIIKQKSKIKKVICELHGNPIYEKNKFLNKEYIKLVSKLKRKKLYNKWFIEHY